MRWSNMRSKDLADAISNVINVKTNGNHQIMLKGAQRAFDPTLETCKHCSLSARCFSQPVDMTLALRNKCECIVKNARVEFYYHDSLCLTYECPQNRITDHSMWGRSVTTSRSISWYLEALVDHGFIDSSWPLKLKKLFKKRSSSEWVYL